MPIIDNPKLYSIARNKADQIYKKPSAYKSGYIQKEYKRMGGTYTDDNKIKNLSRWYKEKWQDIGGKAYPVFRPTIKVNKLTPLTVNEINKDNLKRQIKLKQKIKGQKNLPKFLKN